jgi:hypothetical protein
VSRLRCTFPQHAVRLAALPLGDFGDLPESVDYLEHTG